MGGTDMVSARTISRPLCERCGAALTLRRRSFCPPCAAEIAVERKQEAQRKRRRAKGVREFAKWLADPEAPPLDVANAPSVVDEFLRERLELGLPEEKP